MIKSSKFFAKKSAFSLIELSISLIILGLLSTAVLGGVNLAKGANFRAVISEANSWKSGVATFYLKFEAYPGDFNDNLPVPENPGGGYNEQATYSNPSFVSGTNPKPPTLNSGYFYRPNQNGVIESKNCEGVVAMIDLANIGASVFLPNLPNWWSGTNSGYFPISSDGSNPGQAVCIIYGSYWPTSKTTGNGSLAPSIIDNAGWTFDGIPAGERSFFNGIFNFSVINGSLSTVPNQNYAILSGKISYPVFNSSIMSNNNVVTVPPAATATLNPNDAFTIDQKFDDGRPTSGKILSFPGRSFNSGTCVASDGSYNTNNPARANEVNCVLAVAVDAGQ